MKRVSIKDENGKVYEFELNETKVELLKIVTNKIGEKCIVGYRINYVTDNVIPMTYDLEGKALYGDGCEITPYAKFKDLKRVFAESTIIEVMQCSLKKGEIRKKPFWDCSSNQYRIKGNISIKSWDKHKEVIKEFWKDVKIETSSNGENWYRMPTPDWSSTHYRVIPEPKVEELSSNSLIDLLGYKIKIVKEGE